MRTHFVDKASAVTDRRYHDTVCINDACTALSWFQIQTPNNRAKTAFNSTHSFWQLPIPSYCHSYSFLRSLCACAWLGPSIRRLPLDAAVPHRPKLIWFQSTM